MLADCKCANTNLKCLPASHVECDLYSLENIHPIVIQSPAYYDTRSQMYDDINALGGEIPGRFREEPSMILDGFCVDV